MSVGTQTLSLQFILCTVTGSASWIETYLQDTTQKRGCPFPSLSFTEMSPRTRVILIGLILVSRRLRTSNRSTYLRDTGGGGIVTHEASRSNIYAILIPPLSPLPLHANFFAPYLRVERVNAPGARHR